MSTPLRERPDAPLGTLIFRAGLLPAETIESALEEGVKTGKRLGEILTERGLIKEVDLARLLAGQRGLEYVTLREQIVDPAAAALFTEEQARLFRGLPYTFEEGVPVVAIADPTDDVLIRNIREALGREDVRFVVSTRGELGEIAEDVYSKQLPAPLPALEVEPEAPSAEAEAPPQEPVAAVEPPAAHVDELEHSGNGLGEPALEVPPAPEPAAPEEPALPLPAPLPAEPAAEAVPVDPVPTAPDPVVAPEPVAPEPAPEPVAAVEHPVAPDVLEPVPQPAEAPAPPFEPVAEAVVQPPEEPVVFPAETPAPEHAPAAEAPLTPEPEARVEPIAGPEPATLEPVPSPEPAPPAPMPYPPAATHPEAPLEPVEDPAFDGVVFRVTVRLSNGERVEAGEFADLAAAKQQAKSLVTTVAEADQDDWPYVSGRFLKPDTIVSVDIVEQSGDQPAE
jgi:hypothetical protein